MRAEQDLRARIVAEALSWEGTRYHPGARIKKAPGEPGGVDCALLLAEVYAAAGAVPPIDPGYYSQQWMLHRDDEIYLGWIRRYAREIPLESVRPGDLVAFKFDRTFSHAAIVIEPPVVIHACLRGRSVYRTDIAIEEPFRSLPKLAFSVFPRKRR